LVTGSRRVLLRRPTASGRAYCSPENPAANRPPRISPRASIRRYTRSRSRHGGRQEALAELVALGLVNSDSFGGLRARLVPSAQRRPVGAAKRRGRVLSFGMESAGRWSLIRRINESDAAAGVEHVARTLLRRYGVVFWRLLAPPQLAYAACVRVRRSPSR
jgi:hypothetical protein